MRKYTQLTHLQRYQIFALLKIGHSKTGIAQTIGVHKSTMAIIKKKTNSLDCLVAAFLATYAALNVLGQTKEEVGRLWVFMVPIISLFALVELKTLFTRKDTGIYLVISFQLITTMFTFKFQDFFG